MGGDDSFDPIREAEHARWKKNTELLKELGFCAHTLAGHLGSSRTDNIATCGTCSSLVWLGDLRRQEDLPYARAHHQWHLTASGHSRIIEAHRRGHET